MEVAAGKAPKVIYMAACLLTGSPFDRNANLESLKSENLPQDDLKAMSAFRKLAIFSKCFSFPFSCDKLPV